MGKKIAIGAGILAVLIIGGFVYLLSNLDRIIEQIVEVEGSKAIGTEVALDGVDLDLATGAISFSRLTVANPQGFKAPLAVELSGISVDVDPATLNQDVIVINEIVIDEPVVTYEQAGAGSNLDALKKNVGGGGESADSAPYSGPKLIVEKLTFTGGTIHVRADGVLDEDLETKLPAFTLYDIGKAKGGATPNEVASEITSALTSKALGAVAEKGVKGLLDKALNGAGDTFNNVKDGIGGLFGSGKDEDD